MSDDHRQVFVSLMHKLIKLVHNDDVDHKNLAEINYLFFLELRPAKFPTIADARLHESIQYINLLVPFPLDVIFYFTVSPRLYHFLDFVRVVLIEVN